MFVKQIPKLRYIIILFLPLFVIAFCCLQTTLGHSQLGHQNIALSDYRIVVANKAATLENEINELAGQGYRVVRLSKATIGINFAALLCRSLKNHPLNIYEYKVLNTNRIETISQELQEAARKGAEFRGITAANRLIYVSEYLALAEWIKGNKQPRFEYQVLYNEREEEIERFINDATQQEYTPVEILGTIGTTKIVVLARNISAKTNSTASDFKLVSTRKSSTFEKELNKMAQLGYRLEAAAPLHVALMSKNSNNQNREQYEYKLATGKNYKSIENRISEFALQGFICRGFTSTVEPIMERKKSSSDTIYEYRMVDSKSTEHMQNTIKALTDAGYSILDFYSGSVNVYLFQRPMKKQLR